MGFIVGTLSILFLIFSFYSRRRDHTTVDGAPWVPLEHDVIERILDLAQVKKGDIFYDLGSGDGRVAIAAGLRGARAYGVEIDTWRVWYSRFWVLLFGLPYKVTILHKDIFETDISKADVVTAYLLQETNDKLERKLKKELKDSARVVGVAFEFPHLKQIKVDPNGPIYGPLYLYKMSKKK